MRDGSAADALTSKAMNGSGGASRRLPNIEVADLVCAPPQCGVSAGEDRGATETQEQAD